MEPAMKAQNRQLAKITFKQFAMSGYDSFINLWRPWCLVNHAGVHLFLGKVSSTPQIVHVFEIHHLEGVFVGAAAAHHSCDL